MPYLHNTTRQVLDIQDDEWLDSPREYGNFATLTLHHNRYSLANEELTNGETINSKDYDSWQDMLDYILKSEDIALIYPVYMQDHSSLSFNITPFRGMYEYFDSGQVGFIFASKDKLRKDYNCKNITKKILEKAKSILEVELETYQKYVNNEAYRFDLYANMGDYNHRNDFDSTVEVIDSCGGFEDIDGILMDTDFYENCTEF
jgi:hypothetical protein